MYSKFRVVVAGKTPFRFNYFNFMISINIFLLHTTVVVSGWSGLVRSDESSPVVVVSAIRSRAFCTTTENLSGDGSFVKSYKQNRRTTTRYPELVPPSSSSPTQFLLLRPQRVVDDFHLSLIIIRV